MIRRFKTLKYKLSLFLVFFLVFMGSIYKVLATDNGTGNGVGNSEISGACTRTVCNGVIQPEDKPPVVKLTLVYYDGEKRIKIGKTPVWYLSGVSKSQLKKLGVYDALVKHAKGAPIYDDIKFTWGNFQNIEKWIVGTNKEGIPDKGLLKKQVYKRFGISKADLNRESCIVDKNGNGKHRKKNGKSETYIDPKTGKEKNEEGSCYLKPGYRVIMEPVMVLGPKSGGHKFYTTKELANGAKNTKHPDDYYWWVRWWSWSNVITGDGRAYPKTGVIWRMYTEYADINITKGNPSKRYSEIAGNNYKTIASSTDGVGYYIFDTGTWDTGSCTAFNLDKDEEGDHYKTDEDGNIINSGPQSQNCCEEVEEALKNYSDPNYKDLVEGYMKEYNEIAKIMGLNQNISFEELYSYWKQEHPECTEEHSEEITPELICGEKDSTEVGVEATEEDLIASTKGEKDYTREYMSDNKFLINQINSYCKILCSEKIKMDFPSRLKEQISRGTKIVWPTQENAAVANNYPLTMKGTASCMLDINETKLINDNTYTCTRYDAEGKPYSSRCRNESNIRAVKNQCVNETNNINNNNNTKRAFYDLKGKFNVWHTDEEYGKRTDIELERYSDGFDNGHYKTSGFPVSETKNTFTIEQQVKYKIPDRIYRYIITKSDGTIKSSDTKSGNYTDLGFGNLPVSYNAEGVYDTVIKYSNIGGFKDEKKQLKNKSMEYLCNYKVNTGTKCECPEGPYMGKDLTQAMAGGEDGQTHTCEDAQQKFCDTPYCPDCENDCPTTFPSWYKDFTSGDFAGNTILNEDCKNNDVCTALSCNLFVCPPGTNAAGRPLNAIIAQYLANHPGKPLDKSLLEYLVECSCSDDDNIIYRTIDLKNPFPGKEATGRRSGFNWDSDEIKASVITNNRGVSDDEVYNQQPLYHFTLTPSVVKTIRSYNAQPGHEYDNFDLDCKGDTNSNDGVVSRNCISDFVHSATYGARTDGSCYSAKSAAMFASCAE